MKETNVRDIIIDDILNVFADEGQKIAVETLNVDLRGNIGKIPQLPRKQWQTSSGPNNENWTNADSVKIGKDISIKRIYAEGPIVKDASGNQFDTGNGFYYVVRTKNGEMKFGSSDAVMIELWSEALLLANVDNKKTSRDENLQNFYTSTRNKVLKDKLNTLMVKPDKASKYEKAAAQLKGLGVEPNLLAKYIADKQNS